MLLVVTDFAAECSGAEYIDRFFSFSDLDLDIEIKIIVPTMIAANDTYLNAGDARARRNAVPHLCEMDLLLLPLPMICVSTVGQSKIAVFVKWKVLTFVGSLDDMIYHT